MTVGQELAQEELREIEAASEGTFEVLSVRLPEGDRRSAIAEISVTCFDMPNAKGGIKLRDRERFLIYIPPDFPFDVPSVYTPHRRFSGHPHVQWQTYLCLYQSRNTEWDASDGMFGFISRLELWLRRAALNQLDMEGAPLHPPVAYSTERITVIPRKDTPQVHGTAWFGYAKLRNVSSYRIDIEDWIDISESVTQAAVAAAILLTEPLSWEYPAKAKMLLDQIEKNGVSRAIIRLVMALAADANPADSDLLVIIGAPMRGIRGSHQLKQHLTAWLIKKEMVNGLRLILSKYRPEDGFREIGLEAEKLMEEWLDLVEVAWCTVREDRPEIILHRDTGTPMNVFRERTVAVWGCGAIGAPIAETLARAGVKKLILRDKGIIAPGILSRQPYLDEEIGYSKVGVLAKRLRRIRPDVLVIEQKFEDVRSTVLDSEDWTDDADYVIDTTASMAVIEKLESRRGKSTRRVPVASMVVGHQAQQGLVVVSGSRHSGGPVDVLRNVKIAACSKGCLGDYVDEFWPTEPRNDVFQPEPGCSEATFVGSAADSIALAATMLNLAAVDFQEIEEEANTEDSATAHFVAQPHTALPGIPLHYKFNFQSDIVIEDPQSDFQIRISQAALSEMHTWVRRSALIYGEKAETGGILFGGRDNACRVVWVSEVIGPPSDSESSCAHFICGTNGVAEANDEKRQRTRGSTQYIGMWHTHPTSLPAPSETDFLAMHALVNTDEPSTHKHLLLILGSDSEQSVELLSGFLFSKKDFVDLEKFGVLERKIQVSALGPLTPQDIIVDQAGRRFMVLSDMHFGTPESSINVAQFRDPLIDYMVSRAPWDEIVFTGDLIDINLSTFTRAIEGGTWQDLNGPLFGFRQFVQELDIRMRRQSPEKGLKHLTQKWIYVPGNHDYKIWDMLSSKLVCDDVLASGKKMGSVPTPVMTGKWIGEESFFAGIFRTYCAQNQVIVEYPNHEINFRQEKMVLTHGHYLDAKQTRFNDLSDYLSNFKSPEEIRNARRRIFIETAQYQTVANTISFTMGFRGLANVLVGPDAFGNKIKKLYHQVGSSLLILLFPREARKGKRLSSKQLRNMGCYLEQFCQYKKLPRWFIFGHTHHQGKEKSNLGVDVYNAGSCYSDRDIPITFLEIETNAQGMPIIQLMCIDRNGNVKRTDYS